MRILTVILALLVCTAWWVEPEPEEPRHAPFREAVETLIDGWSDEDRQEFAQVPYDDLILHHFGMGRGIRNTYGLWDGDAKLYAWFQARAVTHPDSMSQPISQSAWLSLNQCEINLDEPFGTRAVACAEEAATDDTRYFRPQFPHPAFICPDTAALGDDPRALGNGFANLAAHHPDLCIFLDYEVPHE